MKKIIPLFILILLFSGVPARAELVEKMNSDKALEKFSRGVTNIATCPAEFVTQIPKAMDESPDYLTGTIMAVGRGIGYTLLRAGAGIYDLATFPFPGSTNYKPIMQPDTVVAPAVDALSN